MGYLLKTFLTWTEQGQWPVNVMRIEEDIYHTHVIQMWSMR